MPLLNAVVDVSHFQKISSLKKVRNDGVLGIIHKATEGRTWTDEKYFGRSKWAAEEGFLWGAYHYGLKGNVKQQVDHFLTTVNPDDRTLMVLDYESTHHAPQMRLGDAEKFVERFHALTGRWPGLYTGQSFINSELGDKTDTPLANCWLWIARYNTKAPKVPKAWSRYSMWQYTDGSLGPDPHSVKGIGLCDRNRFNGTEDDLRRFWNSA